MKTWVETIASKLLFLSEEAWLYQAV